MKVVSALIISLLALVNAPAVAGQHIDPQKLVGIWGSSDDGGETFWGYDQYFTDGSTRSWGTVPQTNIRYEIEAFYNVKQKFDVSNCLTVTNSSHPELMPVGSSWCDEIIEVNDDQLTYRNTDGSLVTLYRQHQLAKR
ncbi:hypothetical protein IC617_09595 [Neiella sp. HB171785]|uniref:DUF2147 domain-containing protein n=1 Tax=Neiella litorisoli TaxID=2771431 RepID=A0A8J6QK31_9GAMM|nr:hypothetical protein [Neiella litorisoli]MBD1389682.1 hypothetical protein [Neiella litorisoli]